MKDGERSSEMLINIYQVTTANRSLKFAKEFVTFILTACKTLQNWNSLFSSRTISFDERGERLLSYQQLIKREQAVRFHVIFSSIVSIYEYFCFRASLYRIVRWALDRGDVLIQNRRTVKSVFMCSHVTSRGILTTIEFMFRRKVCI